MSATLPEVDYRQLRIDTDRGFELRFGLDLSGVLQWRGAGVAMAASGGRGVFPTP